MGDSGRRRPSAAVTSRDGAVTLDVRARAWIEPYWNANHLVRTRDWLLELEPNAGESLRLAALTHDMERHFPGGPERDLTVSPPDDPEYNRRHSERSARIVGEWLRTEGADDALAGEVERLVRTHEIGGQTDEDLVQAADSLSFLEVNGTLVAGWFTSGRCSRDRAKAQLRWMYDRIRLAEARQPARPLLEEALAVVDRA
jgi:hypothetical protein